MNFFAITAILFIYILNYVHCANILGIFLVPSISHQAVFQPIWRELAVRGHNITVITTDPLNDRTLPNLKEIDLHDISYEVWNKHEISRLGTTEEIDSSDVTPFMKVLYELMEVQMIHPEVQQLLQQDLTTFDVVVAETMIPTVYPFRDRCKCPMVGVSSMPVHMFAHRAMGNPAHPIISPDFNLPFSRNLSFWERLLSVAYYLFLETLMREYQKPMDDIVRKHFGQNTRPFAELFGDVDVILTNVNPAIMPPRPNLPSVVEISGLHIKPPKELPKDLKAFMDGSKNGVIYLSFGSNIKSNLLPKEKVRMILDVISELPYNVIWKFEDENLENRPKNLLISKWLPQQDILRHPNTKLFITQGGLQSWEETVYAKVPVVVVPFFGDQLGNARKIEDLGIGRKVNFVKMTKAELKDAITEVLSNESYKKTVEKLHSIAVDQPMTGLEKSIYWIEYTIRHKGAKHLRSPAYDLPNYQYYMLDVIGFVLVVLISVLYILYRIIRFLFNFVRVITKKIKKD